jgi:hypothetical protein
MLYGNSSITREGTMTFGRAFVFERDFYSVVQQPVSFGRDFYPVDQASSGAINDSEISGDMTLTPVHKRSNDNCYRRQTLKAMTIRTFRDPHSHKGKAAARKVLLTLNGLRKRKSV